MAARVALVARSEAADVTCDHAPLLYLGSGGSVTYLQCEACGDVIVRTGSRAWALPSSHA